MTLAAFLNDVFSMVMKSENKKKTLAKLNEDIQNTEGKVSCSKCKCKLKTVKLRIIKCRHILCSACFDTKFKQSEICPVCKTSCKPLTGVMPPGEMTTEVAKYSLPGYEGYNIFKIHYVIEGGRHDGIHPVFSPVWYEGVDTTAYIPSTKEGQKVLALLKVAWERNLTFEAYENTYNNFSLNLRIPFKTTINKSFRHGAYNPDRGYLTRIQDKLAELEVTEDDLKDIKTL